MILRIALLFVFDFINTHYFRGRFSEDYATIFVCALPLSQALIVFPPIIVFFLEKKLGFRFTPKFFENKSAFIAYILLAIPALILEMIIIAFAIFILIMSSGDNIAMLFNSYELQDFFQGLLFNPEYWFWALIWIL